MLTAEAHRPHPGPDCPGNRLARPDCKTSNTLPEPHASLGCLASSERDWHATKRVTTSGAIGLGLRVVPGLILLRAQRIHEAAGLLVPLVILTALIVASMWRATYRKKKRIDYLRAKHGDASMVRLIVQHG